MRCSDHAVTPVLVGLQRVGLVGLREAVAHAAAVGSPDREAVVDRMHAELAQRNYIPDPRDEAYRTALWREYLRHTGGDFRAFLSEVAVTVTGPAGAVRERFVEQVRTVLAKLELQPVVDFEAGAGDEPIPTLVIRGERIATADQSRPSLEVAIRHSVSDW